MSGKRASLGDRNVRPRDFLFGGTPILPPDVDNETLISGDIAHVEPLQKISSEDIEDQVKTELPPNETLPADDLVPPPIQRQVVAKHNFFITPEQNRWINNVCKNYAIENRSALIRHILDTYRAWLEDQPDQD